MRRSSWVVLVLAGIFLLISMTLYTLTFSQEAGRMTRGKAEELVERGRQAVERKDIGGLLALFSRDASILGRTPSNFREVLAKTFAELKGDFRVSVRDIEVRPEGNSASITFVTDIGQKDEKMDVVYFPSVHMRATVRKARAPRWLGLFEAEVWQVTELTSDPPILPKLPDQ